MNVPMTPEDEPSAGAVADESPEDPETQPAYVGMGAAIGIGAGINLLFGTMLDNLALGLTCGAVLETAAGAIMESGRGRRKT